ncbi:MAG: hypothetical protein K9K67_01605 [Bacteriovoracaceae bacterium]|nr:hypothetical protein [Bacteriovoracaceae bacterium]
MPSNGLKILILSVLFSLSLGAEDFGIALPDQLEPGKHLLESFEKDENNEDVDFSMGERDSFIPSKQDEKKSFAIMDKAEFEKKELSEKEKILATGNEVPYTHENRESLIEFKNKEIYKSIYNKGQSSFSFTYIKDEYDVKDNNNIYQQSFENAPGSKKGGSLHLHFDEYFSRGLFNTFYGYGLGVGYAVGKGIFSNSPVLESNVKFQLFTVPIDLRLGFDFVPSRFFKFSFSGGPSAMGLLQSRNDLDREDNLKHRRQVSYGYFGHGKLQISMSALSSFLASKTFSQSDLTNMYFNIEGRLQNYENFQDNISISGASFGLGFTFEYL